MVVRARGVMKELAAPSPEWFVQRGELVFQDVEKSRDQISSMAPRPASVGLHPPKNHRVVPARTEEEQACGLGITARVETGKSKRNSRKSREDMTIKNVNTSFFDVARHILMYIT